MDLEKIPLFAALLRRMDWLSQRQRVLAENIANADTPGFKPRDVKPMAFHDLLDSAPLAIAAPRQGHVLPSHRPQTAAAINRDTYAVTPTGNAVVLEQQLMQVAETQLQHQTITQVYRKHLGMLRTALGRPAN